MIFGSVCSGIEAASVAWMPLDWECAWLSEIESFPNSLLKHRYPKTPNLGDMTKFKEWPKDGKFAIDVLAGGTPCQSFSVAGLRRGLNDPRGNLMLVYLGILDKYRPRWCVWENVPGVLSSNGGRDFGAFLGGLGQLGYGWSYRVMDAQWFGVPQRRRRVFVVGHLGGWRGPAAVCLERYGLQGHTPPSREAREEAARDAAGRAYGASGASICFGGGNSREIDIATCATAKSTRLDFESETFVLAAHETGQGFWQPGDVAGTLRAEGENRPSRPSNIMVFAQNQEGEVRCGETVGTLNQNANASGRNTPMIAFQGAGTNMNIGEIGTLKQNCGNASAGAPMIAFPARMSGTQCAASENVSPALTSKNPTAIATRWIVRRLTPRECERLQGFPDDYTLVPHRGKPAKDGPRYKALGNSWATPCARWIGQRIQEVDEIMEGKA